MAFTTPVCSAPKIGCDVCPTFFSDEQANQPRSRFVHPSHVYHTGIVDSEIIFWNHPVRNRPIKTATTSCNLLHSWWYSTFPHFFPCNMVTFMIVNFHSYANSRPTAAKRRQRWCYLPVGRCPSPNSVSLTRSCWPPGATKSWRQNPSRISVWGGMRRKNQNIMETFLGFCFFFLMMQHQERESDSAIVTSFLMQNGWKPLNTRL